MRPVEVGICAMPRSGSTMLIRMMHQPERRLIALNEHRQFEWSRTDRTCVKQIYPQALRFLLAICEVPVVLVRDPRHIALSLVDWANTHDALTLDRYLDYAAQTADILVGLADRGAIVSRYEELVQGGWRKLSKQLHWPMLESMNEVDWKTRRNEYDRHFGRITTNSITLRDGQADEDGVASAFVDRIPRYVERFGYAEVAA